MSTLKSANKIKNKSAFILVGMPGSGKSTLAKKITKNFKTEYLSSDKTRRRIFKSARYSNAGHEVISDMKNKVCESMYGHAVKLLSEGKKVVIDATHLDPNTRSLAIKTISKAIEKNKICFVLISTKFETIDQRMKKRIIELANEGETLYEGWKRVTSYFVKDFESGKLKWPTKLENIDCIDSQELEKKLGSNSQDNDWKNKIKLICWDLDGTLYPSNPELKKHINDLIIDSIALKNNWTKNIAKKKITEKIKELKSSTKTLTAFGVDGTKFFINIWDTINLALYIKKNNNLARIFHKSEIKNAMFTNSNTLKNVNSKLKAIGINPKSFSFIMTSTQLGLTKPDKRVFQAIIEKSKLLPEEILYVGDRDSVDIIPAKKVGIKTCIVHTHSDHADICAKDPEEILNLFNKLILE